MKALRIPLLSTFAGLALLVSTSQIQAVDCPAGAACTEPVGFVKTTIQGDDAFNFYGLTMVRPISVQGTLSSFGVDSITDANVDFSSALDGAEQYFVEILSGDFSGSSFTISGWTGSTITVEGISDLNSILVGGESYGIREHWTVAKVFGANNEAGLQEGGLDNADLIFISDGLGGGGTFQVYRSNGGFAGIGWRAAGKTTDFANEIIWFTDGIVIKRRGSGPLDLTVLGSLKTGPTIVPIEEGFNFLSKVYPTNGVTLGNSGLFDDTTQDFGLGGGSATDGDLVLFESSLGAGDLQRFFYSTGGFAGVGWRLAGSNVAQDNTVIPVGFVVRRSDGSGPINVKLNPPF